MFRSIGAEEMLLSIENFVLMTLDLLKRRVVTRYMLQHPEILT